MSASSAKTTTMILKENWFVDRTVYLSSSPITFIAMNIFVLIQKQRWKSTISRKIKYLILITNKLVIVYSKAALIITYAQTLAHQNIVPQKMRLSMNLDLYATHQFVTNSQFLIWLRMTPFAKPKTVNFSTSACRQLVSRVWRTYQNWKYST